MFRRSMSASSSSTKGGRGGWLRRVLAPVAALGIVLGVLVPATPAFAAGVMTIDVTITDTSSTPITVVDASTMASYRVNIAYSCSVEDCTDAQVQIDAPPVDPYTGERRKETSVAYTPPFNPPPALNGTMASGYSIDLGAIAAGTNGLIRLDYRVNAQSSVISAGNFFPDGSPITPTVTMTSSNASSVTDSASATWKSYINTPTLTLTTNPANSILTDTELTVNANSSSGCWRIFNGVLRTWPWNLCGDSGQITVDLPEKAQYVVGSGGSYDSGSHSVTLTTSGADAWRQVGGAFRVVFPSAEYPTSGAGCLADEEFTARDVTYTYLDGTTKTSNPATRVATVTVGNCAPFAKASFAKTSRVPGQFTSTNWTIPLTSADAYTVAWEVFASNQANVPGVATIVDNNLDHPDLPITSIAVIAGGPATIQYELDDGTTATATNVTTLDAPAGRRFVAVTATSSTLAGPNVSDTETTGTPFTVRFYATLTNTATPGTRTNTASATMAYPDHPALGTIIPTGSPSSRTVTLVTQATPYTISATNLTPTVAGGGSIVLVGGDVTWEGNGAASNVTPSTSWTPQYVFLAPAGWDIQAGTAALATPVPGETFSYETVTYGGETREAVIVTWPGPVSGTGTVTLPEFSVETTPTGDAMAGTNTADFFVGDAANAIADAYSGTRVVDTTDIDLDDETTDVFSRGGGVVTLQASPRIGITKEICQPDPAAADGCNWIPNPTVPVGVQPDATSITYRVTLTNTGNGTLSNLVAYDVLPYIGDTGTTDATAGTSRGSTVREVLSSVDNVDPGIVLAYSGSTNPPRPEVYSGPTEGDWDALLEDASAIRATVASLGAKQSVSFEYVAALVDGSADQLACNTVAADAPILEPIESAPVCASTQEGDLRIATADRFPLQEGRLGTVPFVVTNGGGSQLTSGTVILAVPEGLSITDLTIPGWDCTAPAMTGPVDVECIPVNPDGTQRSLVRDTPETIPLQVIPASGTGESDFCIDGSIAGLIYDPNLGNNETSSCATLYSGAALLEITKTDGVATASPGDTLTYTITLENRLVAEGVTGAEITDALPGNVRFVSASDGGTPSGADANGNGGTVTWPAVDLAAAGASTAGGTDGEGAAGSSVTRTVTVQVVATASGEVVNETEVTAADPADPAAELTDDANDVDALQRLSVTKASDAAAAGVRADDVVTYMVTLTNDGTADYTSANPAELTDDLSGVLDDASFVAGSAEIRIDGGAGILIADPGAEDLLSWSGPLAAGADAVLTYQVTVGDGSTGDDVLANTAYASDEPSSCTDGLTPDGVSCANVTTQFAPTLAKVVTSSTQNDDGTWTTVYSLVVTNSSPTAAAIYSLSDALAYGPGIAVQSAAVTGAPASVTPAAWSGTGPIATGVSIPAGTQHTYQVTVVADAAAVGGTPAAACNAGVVGGFANRATLTTTDGRTAAAEACASPVEPTVDKSVAAPVQLPDGRWSIVYTLTVSNPNPAPASLPYTLQDALTVPAGITVDSVDVSGPGGAPVNGAFDGDADTALLTGVDRIPAGSASAPATRVFTITVVASTPSGAGSPAQLACAPAGSGGYQNVVTLLAGSSTTELGSDTACADATPQPMPEISKSVRSSAVDAEGDWTIVYDIGVTNPDDQFSTRYTLQDELDLAPGVTVIGADATSTDASASTTWNGSGDQVVATDVALPADTTHWYTVVVEVDPGELDAESALADCRVDSGEDGTGFRNIATVVSGAQSAFSAACEPFTDPSVVKTTAGAPTQNPSNGEWTLTYDVTVTNKSTTTSGTIPYELTDELGFPAGVVILDVDATAPTGGTVNPDFDGSSDRELGSGAIGAAADESTPATQVYTVTVRFAVPAGISAGVACDPAQGPGGLRNEVEVAVGDRISGSVACADLPDVPVPGLTKTVLSQEQQPDGRWLLLYRVTVANPSATAASTYTLDDEIALGDGMTVAGTPTIVSQPTGVTANPAWTGAGATTNVAEDILLPAGGAHTYTVRATVDAGTVRGTDPAGDCTIDGGESATGFGNTALLDTGVTTVDTVACAQAWDPAVTKELNGQPVQQADGSWLLSYTMTVTNPSDVGLSYGLVDELGFPAGTEVNVDAAAGRAGSPAVEPDWDGETQTQLVADGTALPPNGVHVFDVTVRAVLPEDQDSADGGWANTATVRSGVDGVVQSDVEALADILIPELAIEKSATPSDPLLRIGDTVEYEVTIENVGEGDFTALYPAVVWDDLADVLDDADLTAGPTATPGAGTIAQVADRYAWTAPLLSGDTVAIRYTVAVAAGGNADMVNVAFAGAPDDAAPVTPATDACDDPLCAATNTPLPALEVTKAVDTTTVAPGGTVRYTITVTNTGGADIPDADPAVITDDLAGVLNDAVYGGDADADTGTVDVIGTTLTWTGGLAVGESATISYSVTVRSSAPDGAELVNVAMSDPTLVTLAADGSASDGEATTTTTVVRLAMTGAMGAGTAALVALALLLLGLFVHRSARRRTTESAPGR